MASSIAKNKTTRTPDTTGSPRVTTQMVGDRDANVVVSGDLELLMQVAGGTHVTSELIKHLSSLGSHGNRIDDDATNFALGFVNAMQPRDAAETLLLSQMAATHQAMMMMARRLNHVENIPQQDSAERAVNKLGRTFATQMETLKRYRSKGKQVVRVERVNIQEGAQAIVGNVARPE